MDTTHSTQPAHLPGIDEPRGPPASRPDTRRLRPRGLSAVRDDEDHRPEPADAPASVLTVAGTQELDPRILRRLRGEGHAVRHLTSGEQALALPDLSEFDLVLLDALLPGISGFDTCRQLRARSDVAIIFLTSAASLHERLLGFDLGADDYIAAPAEFSEVERRIRAVLGRVRGAVGRGDGDIRGPYGIQMHLRAHQVFVGEEEIRLTPKEYALLKLLLERRGDALSSDEISGAIWGYETFGSRNFVEAHVSRLRRKLSDASADDVIETVRGLGYAIRDR